MALSLGNNELSGPIPAELGGLANLETLADEASPATNWAGPICPAELGGLANLDPGGTGNGYISAPMN